MLEILSQAPIHPYGHRNIEEKPTPDTENPFQDKSRVAILRSELQTLITSITPTQTSPIEHYFLSVPMYFTHHDESLVLSALKDLKLPSPISTITADSSAFLSLRRAKCEHFVACVPVDKEKHILLFVEYSRSTMSASFMNFWGGWFLTPHAYFVDVALGDEKRGEGDEEKHWKRITKRIDDLIHDYEDKLFEGPSDKRKFTIGSLKLIIMGELGSDPKFQQCATLREMVIRDSLEKKGYKNYQRWRDEL
jgi:hypothetical protein